MSRDPKHYFRQSIRLKNYNYSKSGAYFVTITVDSEGETFGKIKEGRVELNRAGELVKKEWMDLPRKFINVKLDKFVIMPDHFHGIVILDNKKEGLINQAPTRKKDWILIKDKNDTLGKIIRAFKAKTAKLIHDNGSKDFKWHRNYYDHIVRDEKDFFAVKNYIRNNPSNWEIEKHNKHNR